MRGVYCTFDTTVSSSPASKGRSSGSWFWIIFGLSLGSIFIQTTKFFSDSKYFRQTHIALEVKLGNVALSTSVDRAHQGNWVEVVDLQASSWVSSLCNDRNSVLIIVRLTSSFENISKRGHLIKVDQRRKVREGLVSWTMWTWRSWNAVEKIRNVNMKCCYMEGTCWWF